MTDRAKITSAEALESFRASLLVYLSKARPTLEEMGNEARQTAAWLENDRRPFWMNEARKRRRALDEAKQSLFSAQLCSQGEPTAARQMAVTRAHRALEDAEDKLRLIHKWTREFENLTAPQVKQLDQVHMMLTTDMKQAATYLARVIAAVDEYTAEALGLPTPAPMTAGSGSAEFVENAPQPEQKAETSPDEAPLPTSNSTRVSAGADAHSSPDTQPVFKEKTA